MKRKPGKRPCWSGKHISVAALLLLQAVTSAPAIAADENGNNVRLYGALVAEPCVIPPGDEEIQLDFGTIIDKYLYLNTRTLGQGFEIRLAECDVTLGKTVTVTFIGAENPALPGLLAIDGGSEATGIAIGLETPQAQPLPLNKASDKYTLQGGNNSIALKAYVQGEPGSIENKAIGRGPFNAVATFALEYE
ncbi:fimbrial protein [Serratia marcescens]|uniref:fimbrial protein n=1 Tax=Serratia marcescens TaxID=615 RepID=UPI002468E304|nr:fimbrial protein [Serratia marcescens]WGL77977.1 fimbrial protein [Serratia marcescens]